MKKLITMIMVLTMAMAAVFTGCASDKAKEKESGSSSAENSAYNEEALEAITGAWIDENSGDTLEIVMEDDGYCHIYTHFMTDNGEITDGESTVLSISAIKSDKTSLEVVFGDPETSDNTDEFDIEITDDGIIYHYVWEMVPNK